MELQEAGIDWLTCTATHNDTGQLLAQLGDEILSEVRERGNEVDRWTFRDYIGYKSDGVRSGARTSDVILQLSGDVAREFWQGASDLATNISRFDVQATARLVPADNSFGKVVYRDGVRFKKAHRPNMKVGMQFTHEGGMTTTFGSRVSDRYMRLYDKFKESKDKHYLDCWRYEIEYKGERAVRAAKLLRSATDPGASAVSLVLSEFLARGHKVQLDVPGCSLPESPRRRTTMDTRLDWAESQWGSLIRSARAVGRLNELMSRIGITKEDAAAFMLYHGSSTEVLKHGPTSTAL